MVTYSFELRMIFLNHFRPNFSSHFRRCLEWSVLLRNCTTCPSVLMRMLVRNQSLTYNLWVFHCPGAQTRVQEKEPSGRYGIEDVLQILICLSFYRKAEDEVNSKSPKRFRVARKSLDQEQGFRPYKSQLPSPGNCRKWKQIFFILFAPDVLNLLEKKKKLVKKNGLLQFVLWREAYRFWINYLFLDLFLKLLF